MKRTVMTTLLLLAAIAGATSLILFKRGKSKVPNVSENPNIPYFIDTVMQSERNKVFSLMNDSVSTSARLTKLGFNEKSGTVLDNNLARALFVLYNVYDSIYPSHQFVNYRCVNELMKKYDLSFGSTTAFICDIPKHEIDSIEAFKPSFIFDRNVNYPIHDLDYSMDELASMHDGYGNIGAYHNDTYVRTVSGKGSLGSEKDLVKYAMLDMKKRPLSSTVFFMLAPASCFKDDQKNEKGNYGKIKDPIVLAPVEGGYIIVTAW